MGTRKEELLNNSRLKNILDNQEGIISELKDIRREMLIDREGKQEYEYGATIEDSDIDLSGVPEREVANA